MLLPFFAIFSLFGDHFTSTCFPVLGIDLDEFVTGCMQLHGPAKPLVVRFILPGANLSANLTH